MTKQRSRRDVLGALGAAGLGGLAGCVGGTDDRGVEGAGATGTSASDESGASGASTTSADALTVFHAGSLTAAYADVEAGYTAERDVTVAQESAGSVRSTKKVTQPPHRAADVLAVADFRLLRDDLLPDYGDWYAVFATNAMTVAYTEDSTYSDEFGPETWWDVLARDDVAVGHSDPAVDPNGYRALMSMQLGAIPYEGERLYDDATAAALRANATVPASDEVDLIGQLRTGKLDYAWSYRSFGATHDVETVDLQTAVDLSGATEADADHYAQATVEAGGTTYVGAPIAYGVTVPTTAEHPDAGASWVAYTLGEGAATLAVDGFETLDPAVVPARHADAVPDAVMAAAEARDSLGPLSL
ncbi:molybdate/tungstate transport system substrate-binding protein [Halarchaeum rubridurum]|uniref:Molybdate/tungstate transport system substrate-binding protein n=1 Tax=Halarchaeum rubridurum TaxID=489911 RepID=A0A830FTK9_9EURY|nr:substrate-binding domain-containing protein [Halarchaeum rubridurum]MBP1954163.1 molybdate/tungstate transport system substrate-binding protein [Halarchaeum rubridurum]GGM57835.1 tungstate ABC transporter substrate-binding protein WtpA [Halarchaeum rubridurum]